MPRKAVIYATVVTRHPWGSDPLRTHANFAKATAATPLPPCALRALQGCRLRLVHVHASGHPELHIASQQLAHVLARAEVSGPPAGGKVDGGTVAPANVSIRGLLPVIVGHPRRGLEPGLTSRGNAGTAIAALVHETSNHRGRTRACTITLPWIGVVDHNTSQRQRCHATKGCVLGVDGSESTRRFY